MRDSNRKSELLMIIIITLLGTLLVLGIEDYGTENNQLSVTTPTATITPTVTPYWDVLPFATINPTTTPVPTASSVSTATPTPTLAPTSTPYVVLALTPTLSPTITPEVTRVPLEDNKWDIEDLQAEIKKITVGSGDIKINRHVEKTYDLYYLQGFLSDINRDEKFAILSRFYVDYLSHWIDIKNYTGTNSVEKFVNALNSSVCQSCRRIILKENEQNKVWMQEVMDMVTAEEIDGMNTLMFNFLCMHTTTNPNNNRERVLLICND